MEYWTEPRFDGVHFKLFTPSGEEVKGRITGSMLARWSSESKTVEAVFVENMDRIKDAALRKHSISGSAILTSTDF